MNESAESRKRPRPPAVRLMRNLGLEPDPWQAEVLEGDWQPKRLVVIEFPDMEAALGWYRSEEYQELAKIRWSASARDGRLNRSCGSSVRQVASRPTAARLSRPYSAL